VTRQAVRPDAAREQEDDLWQRSGGEHVAEVGLRARDVQHGERDRGRGECVPDERDGAAEEEQPELALGQGRQRPAHATWF
jgi:hypothetical protein